MVKDDHLSEFEKRILEGVAEAVEDDGWRLKLTSFGDSFSIEFEHELSSPYTVGLTQHEPNYRSFLANVLEKREFRSIRERPADTPHAKLLQSIRAAAQANDWSGEMVAVLSRVLLASELLSQEEADWLAYAGPAWSEDAESNEH